MGRNTIKDQNKRETKKSEQEKGAPGVTLGKKSP